VDALRHGTRHVGHEEANDRLDLEQAMAIDIALELLR
jgi:hypothetical protein